MILTQIRNIGKAKLGKKSKFEVLVDSQLPYNKKYFLVVKLSSSMDQMDLEIEEYKDENRYKYGRGLESGTQVNNSPSININWNHMSDEAKFKENIHKSTKILNLNMKLVKIKSKVPVELIKSTIAERFLSWLERDESEIRLKIINNLWDNYRTLSKDERPTLVLFKFQDEKNPQNYLFPGEVDIFRQIYLKLAGPETVTSGLCSICGTKAPLISDEYSYGCFTLDQKIFRTLFITDETGKKHGQFRICSNCLTECQEGYNIVENKLKFHAFSIKKGRTREPIYHYIIPQGSDLQQLQISVDFISKFKSDYNKQKATHIFKEITDLKAKLKMAESEKKAELKKKLKNMITQLEKNKEQYEHDTNIDISPLTLIKTIGELDLSFIDMYFKETDLKQNPRTKEVIDVIHLDKTRIKFLARIIEEAEQEHNVKEIKPWWLNDLVGRKHMFAYLQAFYNRSSIDRSEFNRICNKILSRAWLHYVLDISNLYYPSKMRRFRIFDYIFEKAQVFS